ncbi:MAG: hypothetical protein HFH62_04560 [Lachnospiraceae bacterium]|nr:hypothetical protein [Lachnospiraceae bacterium]
MTDLSLQDALANSLKAFFRDTGRKIPWGEALREIHVFTQQLPIKSEGYRDDDGDEDDQWNYVCIVLSEEELKDGEWQVEVHFAVGVKDLDKDCQGHRHAGNLMNEIFLHFVKAGFLEDRYIMDSENAYKKYDLDGEYPYYQGDLITFWRVPEAQTEGLEGLI